ncbi:MAG: FixH family protein [Caulobacteraceae bacterium]
MYRTDLARGELAPEPKGFRLTGRMVLALVAGFFCLVMAVDIGMATMAYRTFSGEVAADPYEAGLLYNRTLAERRAPAALGWTADIDLLKGGDLRVTVKDRAGRPVGGLKVTAVLERPATETGRQTLAFAQTAPGVYDARAGHLAGAWDVRARAVDGQGRAFEAEERFLWR